MASSEVATPLQATDVTLKTFECNGSCWNYGNHEAEDNKSAVVIWKEASWPGGVRGGTMGRQERRCGEPWKKVLERILRNKESFKQQVLLIESLQ